MALSVELNPRKGLFSFRFSAILFGEYFSNVGLNMAGRNYQESLGDHSEAKVTLYGKYLSVFLSILSRVSFIHKIYIFDLMAGEGVNKKGVSGSPMIALTAVKNHFFSNSRSIPDMEIWLNDNGMSEIDDGKAKIERLKELTSTLFIPDNVELVFSDKDVKTRLGDALTLLSTSPNSASLFFLDPYGYKVIDLAQIKQILALSNTEVLLFLPVSFMYRFSQIQRTKDFPGIEPLRGFLSALFSGGETRFRSIRDFINQLKEALIEFLSDTETYVDTFLLESGNNIFALFFFTNNIAGLEKMLEAKWSLDTNFGEGYSKNPETLLFPRSELDNYSGKLFEYIDQPRGRTNEELFIFGLKNGFLPKHTNEALKPFIGETIERQSSDGKPVRGNYIRRNSGHKIVFKIRQKE